MVQLVPRHVSQILTFLWGALLLGTYSILSTTNFALDAWLVSLDAFFTAGPWGILTFILLYAIRPVTFFPMSIMTVYGGFLFGFGSGVIFAYLGVGIAASISYYIGIRLQSHVLPPLPAYVRPKLLHRYPFESITVLHLTMLPFDLINYGAGIQGVSYRSFILAVLVGILPGTVSLTALGAGIAFDELLQGNFAAHTIDWRYVLFSGVVFFAALASSATWRRISTKQRPTQYKD
jgi:uncharacterized membrane protein YdjX (TVP38/TMEM64 family)